MGGVDRDRAGAITQALEERLSERVDVEPQVDRRAVLGGLSIAGAAGGLMGLAGADEGHDGGSHGSSHGNFGARGEFDGDTLDPHEFLRTFNTGTEGQDDLSQEVYQEDGRTIRHYTIVAQDVEIEIAPGVTFPAWTFQGQVPAPTLRAVEGDLVRIDFVNGSQHAHTMHPHLENHQPEMDGVPQNGTGLVDVGESFRYEWIAQPAGVHFYHCHALPLKEHMHRGMYGALIVDPDPERVREHPREYVNYHGPIDETYTDELVQRARSRNHTYDENDDVQELVMVMNSFDTNFDGENEVYAANTRAFAYAPASTDADDGDYTPGETKHPIEIDRDRPVRIHLLNTTEFDPINSLHTHSQFFDYYDHGTTLFPTHKRIDTIMQCQAQRGILELDYSEHEEGLYMFHAHQSEFSELGWMSFFEVVE
ncbi:multicopper oxidase type 3 [Salinarchaeum sp. Harcht-Bsk1]|uniref:multicopper oxidase domain-containing protein n=1 Tax=Salinarchaeum sp. Harcht-Bsk1 TaxID=1333523 RepID=UPI0003423636|nr:multicopper oxidase domain-containing protein [Salinarchaeum sp. Harcht-Bsk1]AGN02638.1 multicopper oxidase type 3 [Salinarchaeum sp. Harcht-Bsk1]